MVKEFYSSVGKKAPNWIEDTIERVEIADTIDNAYLNIRSYLTSIITESYSRFSSERCPKSLKGKLDVCCDQNLIPFVEKHRDCYVITHAIMHKLRTDKYDGYAGGSLRGFADILGFEYGSKKVGGKAMKVAYCSFNKMEELLANSCTDVWGT